MAKRPQDSEHIILKPIRYHGEGEHYRKLITPEDRMLLPFSHLSDAEYQLVIRKRLIAPATAADAKAIKDAIQAEEDAKSNQQKQREAAWKAQKAAALAKQIKLQDGE